MKEQPPVDPPKRSLASYLVRLVGPVLLVVVIVRLRDVGVVKDAFLSANFPLLALAVLLNVAVCWFKVLRADVLLEARGRYYGRKRAWLSFLSSVFVGMLTPGRVGDLLRAQYFKHDLNLPYAEGIALLVVDRLCDLYVLMAFVAVAIARFSTVVVGELAVITWVGVLVTVAGPLVLFIPGLPRRIFRIVYRKVPKSSAIDGFDSFIAALSAQKRHHLVRAAILTTLAFGVNYAQGFLVARAMHLDIAFFDVVCLLAIASLLGLLPISISGVGVREAFFSVVFPALGFSSAMGVVYGIGVFLVIYVATVFMGLVSWYIAPPPVASGP